MKPGNCTVLALAAIGVASGGARAQSFLAGLPEPGAVFQRGCATCPGASAGLNGQNGAERQGYVGMDGKLGMLSLGRQHDLQYLAMTGVADPFKGAMAGGPASLTVFSDDRLDNTIKYATRKRKGVIAQLAYRFGETADNNGSNRAYGASLGYAGSALSVRLVHQRKNIGNIAPGALVTIDTRAHNSLIAANLDLGAVTAYAAYGHNKGAGGAPWNPDNPYGALRSAPATNSRDVLVGMSVALGASTLMGSYIRKDERDSAGRDADQLAVGLCYAISKGTDVVASYARTRYKNGAAAAPAGYASTPASGNAKDGGALNLVLRRAF
jgi:predicted porin